MCAHVCNTRSRVALWECTQTQHCAHSAPRAIPPLAVRPCDCNTCYHRARGYAAYPRRAVPRFALLEGSPLPHAQVHKRVRRCTACAAVCCVYSAVRQLVVRAGTRTPRAQLVGPQTLQLSSARAILAARCTHEQGCTTHGQCDGKAWPAVRAATHWREGCTLCALDERRWLDAAASGRS